MCERAPKPKEIHVDTAHERERASNVHLECLNSKLQTTCKHSPQQPYPLPIPHAYGLWSSRLPQVLLRENGLCKWI